MAITFLDVVVNNPSNGKEGKKLNFLVDSGAIYSVVPRKTLQELKVNPVETREFQLANGKVIKRKMGVALFAFQNRKGGAPVVFGEKGDSTLLGATTLEALGMALDPLKRQLIQLPMVLG